MTSQDRTTSSASKSRAGRVWWVVVVVSLAAAALAAGVRFASPGDALPAQEKRTKRAKAVRVAAARTASIPLVEDYRGELLANVAELAAQGIGRLLEVRVDLGDRFQRGDVLAVVDATQVRRLLGEARAQVRAAEAAIKRAQAELSAADVEAQRAGKLLAEKILSEQEAAALESRAVILRAEIEAADAQRLAARARVQLYAEQMSQARLTAPFDGAVAERYLDPGSMAQPGTRILRLVEQGPLQLRFRASERYISRLEPGASVSVTTASTGELKHPGRVTRVSAEVSRSDRSIAVEGVLEQPHDGLRPGMYARVRVKLGMLNRVTLVPSTALIERRLAEQVSQGVFVVEDGIASFQPVQVLGRHQGSRPGAAPETAVSPLQAGRQVIVFGQETIRDGAPVKALPSPSTAAAPDGSADEQQVAP